MIVICATAVPMFHQAEGLHRVRISGEALRRQDTRAGQHHISDPARACGGADASMRRRSCSRSSSVGRSSSRRSIMGVPGRHLHGDRRHQGGHLDRRAADAASCSWAWSSRWSRSSVLLPPTCRSAMRCTLAGAAGRLNAVTTTSTGTIATTSGADCSAALFLSLAYFGRDQSQVQRYLTGKSIAQSRLSLLFNAVAKIPMQFFILFIGRDGVRVLHVHPAADNVQHRGAKGIPDRNPNSARHRANIRTPGNSGVVRPASTLTSRR